MTHKMKKLLLAAAMVCSAANLVQAESSCSESTSCCSGCMQSQNTFQPRAFSVNLAREIMLQKPAWEGMDDQEGWHGAFGVGFNYSRNFGENCSNEAVKGCCTSLGSVPFWSGNNEMTLGGNSGKYDFDVYQIGLGAQEAYTSTGSAGTVYTAQNGTVRLDPRIYQTGADFFLYAGAHKTERGFFVKLHGPVGVMSVDPRLSFAGDVAGRAYERGILNGDGTTAQDVQAAPYENIEQAFAGEKEAGFLKKMKYGKIDCKRTSSAKFGDLAFAVGYNVFADESKHLGVALRFSAPTGNKSDAEYVFDPIFGRNGHWAAGAEVIGHWRAWESDSSDNYLDIWMDGTVEHLFRSKHTRSFDLKKNGLGSKYLLVAKYSGTPGQFQNEIQNAVNLTSVPVESTFGVEGNMALMFDFHFGNWNAGLGYEIWGRTCEKLAIDCKCPTNINLNEYAVLGRQAPFTDAATPLANNLCEPAATIGKSQNRASAATSTIVSAANAANRISSELTDALDIDGQRAHAAVTSKVFGQVAYTWKDSDYSPFMGVMGSGEFSHKDNTAIKFWSVGLHGGLAF